MTDTIASSGSSGILAGIMGTMFRNSAITSYLKVTIALGIVGGVWGLAEEKIKMMVSRFGYNFIISVAVDSKDESFRWIMEWLSAHPYSLTATNLGMITQYDEDHGGARTSESNRPRVIVSPFLGNHFLKYKGSYYWITRSRDSNANDLTNGGFYECITVTLFGRNRKAINGLLQDAMDLAFKKEEGKLVLWVNANGSWSRFGAPRIPRPLSSVILDARLKDLILSDVTEFLSSKAWYRDMGIPFRRGYLLYGYPGTGKSSFIRALAGELKVHLCLVSLNDKNMTDEDLNSLLNNAPPRSILLLEDVDAAFTQRDNGETASRVTFSGLLNALDGVGSQEGKILFMTTNKINMLDPALIRPGRVDVRCFFGLANRFQIGSLYERFYPGSNHEAVSDFKSKIPENTVSMADLQGYLLEHKKYPIKALQGVEEWLKSIPKHNEQQCLERDS
eukprot:TRINITY_DN3267_c0_g2_i1.p2 TRINITY_DN3267_c0_g2~~TRINITY_DN3267_c0_g2_i1.p2  ORF type:complete len:448 (-),score=154.96 TRINITY_DN3267_c0_g2_i1:46-1389(-)